MPRIRTIKPEFWTDGDVVDMTPFARLLFIGSWNFAICDRGHVADDAKRLKMQVLPADNVDAAELIDEIIEHGRMERLTAPDGRTYLLIKRFTDHQKIEKRWNPRCPACDSFGLNLSQPLSTSREVERDTTSLAETPPTSAQEGKGGEGKGKEGVTPRKRAAIQLPNDWKPTDEHKARCVQDGIDLSFQVAKFEAHAEANDRRQVNWNAAFTQWLLGVPEWQKGNVARPSTPFPANGTEAEKDAWVKAQPLPADGAYYGGSRR